MILKNMQYIIVLSIIIVYFNLFQTCSNHQPVLDSTIVSSQQSGRPGLQSHRLGHARFGGEVVDLWHRGGDQVPCNSLCL